MSVNCQHSSPSGGALERDVLNFSSLLLGRGGGGGMAPGRGGEGMNDHSKLEARQNSISWLAYPGVHTTQESSQFTILYVVHQQNVRKIVWLCKYSHTVYMEYGNP